MKSGSRTGFMRAIVVLTALFAGGAEAALYKCKQPDGSIRFSDAPCPATPGARKDPVVGEPVSAPDPEAAVAADPLTAPAAAPTEPAEPVAPAPNPTSEPEATTAPTPAPAPAPAAAPDSGRELRAEPVARHAWDFIVWSGLIVSLVAGIFMLVHAWRNSSKWWVLGMLLLAPASIIYALIKREKAVWIALLLSWGSPLVSYAAFTPGVDLAWADDGAVTRYQDSWPANSRARFSVNDRIKVVTSVRWHDARSWDRNFFVNWVWYTGDEEVGEFQQLLRFDGNPYVFEAHVPAEKLGAGSHRVEVYIDGELFQVEPFEVTY